MSHHTWIHSLTRGCVKPLINTPVIPNHITTLRLVAGLAAAGALAVGGSPWINLGAGLFVLSFLLDRADGETDQPAGIERRGIKPTRNGRRDERGPRHCGRT